MHSRPFVLFSSPDTALAALSSSLVILIGSGVLLGWSSDLPLLRSVLPGLVSMKPNTALALILAGLAVLRLGGLRLRASGRALTSLLATAVGLLGGLTLLEYLGGWDLGLDTWLFSDAVRRIDPPYPGRMAPASALAFVLIGITLLVLPARRGPQLGQLLALGVGLIGLFNIIGYTYGVQAFSSYLGYTQVALHTAIAFLLLSLGLLWVRPDRGLIAVVTSATVGGILARRLLPATLLLPFLLGGLRLWGQQAGWYGLEFGVALFSLTTILFFSSLIWWTARALGQLDAARVQAEAALRENEQRLFQFLEAVPVGLAIIDAAQQPYYVNRAGQQILGAPAAVAALYQATQTATAQRYPAAQLPMVRAFAGDTTMVDDLELHQPERIVPLQVWGAPIYDAAGRIVYAIVAYADITERRRAATAHLAQAAAEQANAAKTEFLGHISHELRTPLQAILGFGELLEGEALPLRAADSVAQIRAAGRYLLTLINEVLDIARIEAGQLVLAPEPVRLGEILAASLALVQPSAARRQVTFVLPELATATAYVRADPQRLQQVLLNLLSNAIKYNRCGGTVTLAWEARPGARLYLTVADTGCGLPPQARNQQFQPFARLGAEASEVEGTGVGLALAQHLMTAMDGALGLAHTSAAGSTFWVELPLTAPPTVPPVPRASGTRLVPIPGPARTLLLIDDNPANQRLIARSLELRPGVTLVSALQGQRGLEMAQLHHPDLILLDLHLPDLAGEIVLRRLREDPGTAAIPVVIFSADATPGQAARLRAAGATDYLTKPFRMATLLALLDQLLASEDRTVG